MRKNSVKYSRMNEEVQREISKILSREMKDPRIAPMTSVVSCEVTPDLKFAKVFVSVYGDEQAKADTAAGLKNAAPYIRTMLAKNLNLRNTPELTFIVDDSIEYGVNMSRRIAQINGTADGESAAADMEEGTDAED